MTLGGSPGRVELAARGAGFAILPWWLFLLVVVLAVAPFAVLVRRRLRPLPWQRGWVSGKFAKAAAKGEQYVGIRAYTVLVPAADIAAIAWGYGYRYLGVVSPTGRGGGLVLYFVRMSAE